ncbi:MAG: FAD-dependent oxidoreductase, partial [Calditrichaeota bacterium]
MMTYDVLVAGGGPAGLSAACAAARAGARVALFEKSREFGYPIHTSGGSWVTPLRALGIPERFMHFITEGEFIAPAERALFCYQEPPSCVLDVRGLYQFLAEHAAAAGAALFVHTPVVAAHYEKGRIAGLVVRRLAGREVVIARLVIDATGAAAVVARGAGLSPGFR